MICLLQKFVQQSNFGDTLECVDRVERTSNPVSVSLHMRGTMIMMCMYHYIILIHTVSSLLEWLYQYSVYRVECLMAIHSEMSCWSCCKFNCFCAVAHHSFIYFRNIYDIWVCWLGMYVKFMFIGLGWLDSYMFVADSWTTIKFRWYPRMRGQGWADFKPCKFYYNGNTNTLDLFTVWNVWNGNTQWNELLESL